MAAVVGAGDSIFQRIDQYAFAAPDGVEARWVSAENPTGEKEKAGQSNRARRGMPLL